MSIEVEHVFLSLGRYFPILAYISVPQLRSKSGHIELHSGQHRSIHGQTFGPARRVGPEVHLISARTCPNLPCSGRPRPKLIRFWTSLAKFGRICTQVGRFRPKSVRSCPDLVEFGPNLTDFRSKSDPMVLARSFQGWLARRSRGSRRPSSACDNFPLVLLGCVFINVCRPNLGQLRPILGRIQPKLVEFGQIWTEFDQIWSSSSKFGMSNFDEFRARKDDCSGRIIAQHSVHNCTPTHTHTHAHP